METIIISKSTGKPFSVKDNFTLNGNVEESVDLGIKSKISSAWLSDHRSFYIKSIIYSVENGITKESSQVFSYALSDDGKTLTQTNESDYQLEDGSIGHRTAILVFDKVGE